MINILAAAMGPVFVLLFYIWFRDKYEKEPFYMLLIVFLAGALTTLPVIFIERGLMQLYYVRFSDAGATASAAWHAFVVAAFTEESFKMLAFILIVWRSKHFNEKFDGIVYAAFVSLGFAAVENVLYVMQYGYSVAAMRAFTAVPAHAVFGVSMGYFFGKAKLTKKNVGLNLVLGFSVAFLLHGVYDFILMLERDGLILVFIPYVIYLFYSAHRRMKRHSESSRFRKPKPNLPLE